MRIFVAKFTLYNKFLCKNTEFVIKDISIEGVKKAVKDELTFMSLDEEQWYEIEKDVYYEELTFPIIEYIHR